VFTARYALSPYIKQIGFVFKGLIWRPKKFSSLSAPSCSGVTQASHMALPPQAPQPVQVWSQWDSNEGHFTLATETVFPPYLASHCSGGLQHHTWHSLDMRHNQRKSGQNQTVRKGTLLLRPKQFFVPISPCMVAE
jgi:hypothetical protein